MPPTKGEHMTRSLTPRLRWAAASVLALTAGLAAPAVAASTGEIVSLPAASLDASLMLLARQTGQQLLYTPDMVAGRRARAVHGDLTPDEALTQLLAATDLRASRTGPHTLVLQRAASRATPVAGGPLEARPFGGEPAASGPSVDPDTTVRTSEAIRSETPHTVEELRVTGSHIRGARPAAPLVVLDRAALEGTGQTTLASAINSLPQVFGGQATEGTQATRADISGSNTTFATGVNLRGLGPTATLVLVNGRRVSGSGGKGEFVDLSTIPSVAVERVEVLLDGASAVYGSDAVGGVVNIILRKDYRGGEARLRVGAAADGGPAEGQLGLALGRQWSGGGFFLSYEGYRRTALNADDRDFTASADLRPFGGSDRRETFSYPGNILGVDPITRAVVPLYGIPAGQPGVGLTPGSFQAGTINRQTPQLHSDILPDQREHMLYGSIHQAVGPALELSGDVRYANRRARALLLPSIATLTVTSANPFFVSPTGASSQQIAYSFAGELPDTISYRRVESLTGTLAADLRLSSSWSASGYVAYSREHDAVDAFGTIQSLLLAEALGNTPDRPETSYSPARDGYFNPYTGIAANRPAVLNAINSGFTLSRSVSRVTTANLQADGSLFDLPAGPLKLAIGAQARREEFASTGLNYLSTLAPVPAAAIAGRRTVSALFGEIRAPLRASTDAGGALEASVAARGEDYSDFGQSFNPTAGLLWSPTGGLQLRATYGHAFRAPGLRDLRALTFNSAITVPANGSSVLVLSRQGGNPDLHPETATTLTFGADIQSVQVPGLQLSATWFHTRFQDRIDRPAASNLAIAFTDPRFAAFAQHLDPRNNAADLALIRGLLADPATRATSFPPESFAGILDLRLVNTGVLTVSGLDLSGRFTRPAWAGQLTLSANGSRMLEYAQQLTATSPSFNFVGQAAKPAKLRARAGVDWSRDAFSVALAANYTSAFSDSLGHRIRALTILDLQAGWAAPASGPWRGVSARLSVRNIFDTAPPFYDNPLGLAYDPASGDPIGRVVALQLTKSW